MDIPPDLAKEFRKLSASIQNFHFFEFFKSFTITDVMKQLISYPEVIYYYLKVS